MAVCLGGVGTVGGTRVKELLVTLFRVGREGGSREMALVCGRVGLGTGTRYHLLGRFGTVRRTRAKEGLGIISRAGRVGVRGNWSGWVGGKE
jgi:hypothetical protein